jgi:signal transduction histidine kinase
VLSVPMLNKGRPIGAISVTRKEPGWFSDTEIALLETFADQAVIAIENVRLFNELQEKNRALTQAHSQVTEALDQQTATSDILGVISRSPTNVQPIFDAIVRSAAALCHAPDVIIIIAEDDSLRMASSVGSIAASVGQSQLIQRGRLPLTRGSVSGRAFIDRRTVHVHDVSAMPDDEFREGKALQKQYGGRGTTLAVPLLREDVPLGVITLVRNEVAPFTDRQVALLETFADQAVIAIENVRLFKELQDKNRALTEAHAHVTGALEQQTATSEILRVINQSPTDVQPVFDTILRNGVRLCGAIYGSLYRFDGQLIHLVANHNLPPELLASWPQMFPLPLSQSRYLGKVLTTGNVLRMADVFSGEWEWSQRAVDAHRTMDAHSAMYVPILRQGQAIGVISLFHRDVDAFIEAHVALLQTFADQAVIAIENVRLFNELAVANRELAAASQHKSEFLANMSHELRTPLNAIIGFSEVLSEKMFGELNEKQEEYSKDIHASGQHLLSLINDILDLSKIEAGRMELDLSDFDLPTALDSALTLVRERAGRRGIALLMNVDDRLGQIQADERKIRQVVLNLLSNAIKFTPEGGRIEVQAAPKDGLVEVSVSDTGVGIAPEDQEAIFEEFRQVGTADKKVEGTGLGLALSRKFIELHGGRIWVTSQVGMGSTFTFTIPVRHGE